MNEIKEMKEVPFFYFSQFQVNTSSHTMITSIQELDLTYPTPKIIGVKNPSGSICFLFSVKKVEISYPQDYKDEDILAVVYTGKDCKGNEITLTIQMEDNEEGRISLERGYATKEVHDDWLARAKKEGKWESSKL